MAARYPLKNVLWQNAGDESVLPALLGTTKEIWIAIRTDGKSGAGTKNDPFDGSTRAKFDAVFLALYNSGVEALKIFLTSGTFITRGSIAGWQALPRWNITGAGREQTEIQFDATYAPTAGQVIRLILSGYNVSNEVRISDLTLNSNSQNVTGATAGGQKNFSIAGAYLYGNNNVYTRVKVKNCTGSSVNGLECFDLGNEGYNDGAPHAPTGNLAFDCIAETPRGDYHTGILIGATWGGAKTPYGHGNSIIHSTATGYSNASATGTMAGLSANTVAFCTVTDCNNGLRWEPATDVKVINNNILASNDTAIFFGDSSGVNNVLISGNTIEMRDDAPVRSLGIWIEDFSAGADRNVQVINNTFTIKSGGNTVPGGVRPFSFVTTTGCGHSVINNHFQAGLTYDPIPSDMALLENRTLTGATIASLPDRLPSGTGDVSSNTASSVDSEIALFSSTTGKIIKRASLTGLVKATAGVASVAAAGADYLAPAGSGAGLTALNASAIASGTVPTARLGSGTANNTTFLRGDQAWAGVSGATIPSTSQVLIGDGAGNATTTTETGTGNTVRATSPTLTTPVLGIAAATSVNKHIFTAPATAATHTAGADNCVYAYPDITCQLGFRNIPVTDKSTAYTTVLSDNGKAIRHPSTDANPRTFTIDSNANVAQPIGTIHGFINMSASAVTIAITADTMYLEGAGSTGSRTLAQYGKAFAWKMAATEWLISGSNLT